MWNFLPLVKGVHVVCSILFVLSLGGLSSPTTSRRGNYFGMIGMSLAICSTSFEISILDYLFLIPALAIGGGIGSTMALKVKMASMPQMVAALHSFVGLAAVLVSFSSFSQHGVQDFLSGSEIISELFIGGITFTGSLVAYGKFTELLRSDPLILFGFFRHILNSVLVCGCGILGYFFLTVDSYESQCLLLLSIAFVSGLLGWHLVMAIDGGDMPVVVSMLNSFSGWAIAMNGFFLENWLLLITGALVGSSGAILSYIMCKAMNRSFITVIAGGFGKVKEDIYRQSYRTPQSISLEGITRLLRNSTSIIIVPGYGMAASRCHHKLAELSKFLIGLGKTVRFCIHPVAGRLPGHMNVLLAEANVDYTFMEGMEEINPQFRATDLVLVVGGNDIVNPDAMENDNSSVAGMAVCMVWKAKSVVVLKRSPRGLGFSKANNPLFTNPRTVMYYGDALESLRVITAQAQKPDSGFYRIIPGEVNEHLETEDFLPDAAKLTMTLGVPKEISPLERRVAATPPTVIKLKQLGFLVKVESGAGMSAGFSDESYLHAGAAIVSNSEVWNSEVILKVKKLESEEESKLQGVRLIIGYANPSVHSEWLERLARRWPGLTYLSMDCVPRIDLAQKIDSISSMGTISGYRAVVEAFKVFQRCPMPMFTAAGKLPPATVLVIGAGVTGCSAISYCKSLGCIVKATDNRMAARDDAESMGATFLPVILSDSEVSEGCSVTASTNYLKAQHELIRDTAKNTDVIIASAAAQGHKAPILIDERIIRVMRPGSVIVDMGAEVGGICSVTVKDQAIVTWNGVTVIGYTDLVSRMASQSSELYAKNLLNLITEMGGAEKFRINENHEIVGAMMVINKGRMNWYMKPPLSPSVEIVTTGKIVARLSIPHHARIESNFEKVSFLIIAALFLGIFVGIAYATQFSSGEVPFMTLLVIFVLAVFLGFMVILNVTPVLYTPLISATNAISGIIVIAAILLLTHDGQDWYDYGFIMGVLSVMFASINIFGGFIVTFRMLHMFKTGTF